MMANNAPNTESGEAKHTQSQKGYWRYQFVSTVIAVIVLGAIAGLITLASQGTLPTSVAFIAAVSWIAVFIWFARDFLNRIDEVEREDCLWSAYYALAFFIPVYPMWHYLHDKGLVEFPMPRIMFFATCGVYFVTFCARRLGWR